MKTISILIISMFLLSLGTGVFAQETELPEAGWTPDSPFYFLEIIAEEIVTFFTFGDLKKAERYTALAAERLAEAEAVADKGKPELVKKALEKYENQLVKASLRIEKAKTEGKNTGEATKTIDEAVRNYFTILEEALEGAPEEVKPAVRHAMVISTKEGLEITMEAAKGKDAPDQGWLRELCIEREGPSEMCESIPLQGFESFEVLSAFCVEQEGPPELCGSMQAICEEEFGVTTPDECFRVLSTASTKAISIPERAVEPGTIQSGNGQEEKEVEQAGEQVLQRSELSELLRAKCIEKGGGGPSEMCESIPLQGFESFETYKAWCLYEVGGLPEACEWFEANCREMFGLTTANECFLRFLDY